MYAVIAIFRSQRPTETDPSMRYLREHIVPAVSAEQGFVAGYWAHDGERSYNTLVFETRQAAENRGADIRGNAANQASAGMVLESIAVAEVVAHATAPTASAR